MHFYHILTPQQYTKHNHLDYIEADSLHTEGFIHCSYAEQLAETIQKYFSGLDQVVTLKIDPELLTSKLVIEQSRNGELFPHIYGVLNKSAIVEVEYRTQTV
jgi:uncharacterized protein (DUF952 family)